MRSSPQIASPNVWQALIGIVLFGLAAYHNSLAGAFVFDDHGMVVDPDLGRPLQGRLAGRPVVSLSFTLNYWLDGFQTRGYHLVNLLIHALTALTLFDLIRQTLSLPQLNKRYEKSAGWIALSATLLWLVHPLNTQAVTYIVQRCESLMGLLVLVAIWCYLRGHQHEDYRWYWLAGFACILASGCKEITLAVPVLVTLYDRLFLAESWRETIHRWRPLAILTIGPILGIVWLMIRGVLTDASGTVGFSIRRFTPWTYALTQMEVLPHYVGLAFWPRNLCLDYLDWPVRSRLVDVWPWATGLSLALVLTCWGLLTLRRWSFIPAWFFVILAPTSSVVPIQDPAFEHRMYLPLIAVILATVLLVEFITRFFPLKIRVCVSTVLTVVLLVVWTIRTVQRNEDYASEERLLAATLAIRPDNARSRMLYAEQLLVKGQAREALVHAERAMQRPDLVGDPTIEARCHQELGHLDEAERLLRKFLESREASGPGHYFLASVLLQAGKPNEAEPHARQAREIQKDLRSRLILALVLESLSRFEEANAIYAETRQVASPDFQPSLSPSARRVVLDPHATHYQLHEAYRDALAAVRLNTVEQPEEWDTYAIALARLGRYEEALRAGERALANEHRAGERAKLIKRLERYRAGRPYLPSGTTDE